MPKGQLVFHVIIRGGVEDTRLKAKDTKNTRPRIRTAFPRTEPLEAKDQGHRRKRSPKKKSLQKFFSGDLQFIGVPRIFGWGRPKPQIT